MGQPSVNPWLRFSLGFRYHSSCYRDNTVGREVSDGLRRGSGDRRDADVSLSVLINYPRATLVKTGSRRETFSNVLYLFSKEVTLL